ncbi:MAG: SLC13 family permease [Desulfovibrio sp.]
MADFIQTLHWLWAKLPLVLLFINGYLVYRVLDVTGLTEHFVLKAVRKSKGRVPLLLFMVMTVAAGLSLFIPNMITVLTLLPVLKLLDSQINNKCDFHLTTPLTLATVYGANVGGMGSLIGSPANLFLLGVLEMYGVEGREAISFFNWFMWALPLVLVLISVGWLLLIYGACSKKARTGSICLQGLRQSDEPTQWQRSALLLFIGFLMFWIGDGVLAELWDGYASYRQVSCIAFFGYFVLLAFFKSGPPCYPSSVPLLRVKDLTGGVPLRGGVFLIALVAIVGLLRYFKAEQYVLGFGQQLMEIGNAWLLTAALVFLVVLFTEIFSNTLVSTTFFALSYGISMELGINPIPVMVGVSIASTCAFMTPVATPCNALAFGEMRGLRIRRVVLLGLIYNVITCSLITLWVNSYIPY